MFEQILAKLPPKIVLDDSYLEVLDTIKWMKLPTTEQFKFTIEDVLSYLSTKIEKYHQLKLLCERFKKAQAVCDEVVRYLVDAGLIKEANGKFIRLEEFAEFVRFLKKGGFKDSITRLIAWAVWYFHNQEKSSCFEISQILKLLPNVNKESVERALKRLKLEFKNGLYYLDDIALLKILRHVRGKISNWWPAIGTFYLRDTKYIKIAHGVSSTIYVDFPIDLIIYEYFSNLQYIDKESANVKEFYENAKKVTEYYNSVLLSRLKPLVGTNINWLYFSLLSSSDFYREKKYQVKINVNWRKFLNFINEYSETDHIELWRKYRYITGCKYALLEILTESRGKIREGLPKVQERVKYIAKEDLDKIHSLINALIDNVNISVNKIRDKIIKIRRIIKENVLISSVTLLYLPEFISTLRALKVLVNYGIFPACYREMRKIAENLAWVMFDDILFFRSLIVNKYWRFRPYSDIPKEWHDLKSRFASIYDLKQVKDKLKKDFLKGIKCLKHDKNLKDNIVDRILEDIAYPLFISLFSKAASNIDQNVKRFLPVISSTNILNIAKGDLQRILNSLNLNKEATNEILKKLETYLPLEIIIPFPSNRFVLEFIDRTFSTNLYKFYSEYSFFVHSYFTSWHVIPFSSVLEMKIFKHELNKFSNEIKKVLSDFTELLNQIRRTL